MLEHSVFLIPCICGHEVRSKEKTAVCPECGRVLVVEGWGEE